MVWIAIERLVGPHDHVVVPALIPERAGDLDVGERRRRVAFQTLQFQLKPALQVAERFHQVAVVEVRFGETREEAWHRYLAEHPESAGVDVKIFHYPNPNRGKT